MCAQQFAGFALSSGAARVGRVEMGAYFVISAAHLDFVARSEVAQCEVHGAAPVVARALARVSHEPPFDYRRVAPHLLGNLLGAVPIEHQ